jgi:hypothetical protein
VFNLTISFLFVRLPMQLDKFKSLTKQSRRLIGVNRDLHPFANNGDVQLVVMWRELFG